MDNRQDDGLPLPLEGNATEVAPLMVDRRQLAEILKVSPRLIQKLQASAHLPAPIRLGRAVRWRGEEIRSWVDAGCPQRDCWELMYPTHLESSPRR